MRKLLTVVFAFCFGIFLVSGCGNNPSSPKALNDTDGISYCQTGMSLCQSINGSMIDWASGGSVNSLSVAGIKSASVKSHTVTGPDANGYSHLIETSSQTQLGVTYEYQADLYIKLVTNEADYISDVYVYGSYSLNIRVGGAVVDYAMTFGSGVSSPFHGSATWSGSSLTSMAINGPLSLAISATSQGTTHSVSMAYTISNFTMPVTSGKDYPTGSISVSVIYDGVTQPTMTLTCNGTSTASITYGDYSSTISLDSV